MKIFIYIILAFVITNSTSKIKDIKALQDFAVARDNAINCSITDGVSEAKRYSAAMFVRKSARTQTLYFSLSFSALVSGEAKNKGEYTTVSLKDIVDGETVINEQVFDLQVIKKTVEYITIDNGRIFLVSKIEEKMYYLSISITPFGVINDFIALFQPQERLESLLSDVKVLDGDFSKFCLLTKKLNQKIWSSLDFISAKNQEENNTETISAIKALDNFFAGEIGKSKYKVTKDAKASIDKKIHEIFENGVSNSQIDALKKEIQALGNKEIVASKLKALGLKKGFLKYYFKDKLYQKYHSDKTKFLQHYPGHELSMKIKAKKDKSNVILKKIKPMFHPELRARADLDQEKSNILNEVIFVNDTLLKTLRIIGKDVGIKNNSAEKGKLKTHLRDFEEYNKLLNNEDIE
jgi:hypothetical protein